MTCAVEEHAVDRRVKAQQLRRLPVGAVSERVQGLFDELLRRPEMQQRQQRDVAGGGAVRVGIDGLGDPPPPGRRKIGQRVEGRLGKPAARHRGADLRCAALVSLLAKTGRLARAGPQVRIPPGGLPRLARSGGGEMDEFLLKTGIFNLQPRVGVVRTLSFTECLLAKNSKSWRACASKRPRLYLIMGCMMDAYILRGTCWNWP